MEIYGYHGIQWILWNSMKPSTIPHSAGWTACPAAAEVHHLRGLGRGQAGVAEGAVPAQGQLLLTNGFRAATAAKQNTGNIIVRPSSMTTSRIVSG